MKKSILPSFLTAAFLLLVITGMNAQKIKLYDAKWQSGAPLDEEGMINRMQFEDKSQFSFLITNDDKNLYVDLIMAEKAGVQKIMRYGLTTWFNPEGKHKKTLGVQFPVTSEGKSEPSFMKDKGDGDRKEMRMAMMASKNEEMILTGFGAKGEQIVIDPRKDSLFRGKVEMMEGGKLHISLVLPLEKLGLGNSATAGSLFSAGFETGYLDLTGQGAPAGGGQGAGGDSHGGGMYGGGGMPGGGPPQGGATGTQPGSSQQQRPDISELASPSKLWINQVKLAEKPK